MEQQLAVSDMGGQNSRTKMCMVFENNMIPVNFKL